MGINHSDENNTCTFKQVVKQRRAEFYAALRGDEFAQGQEALEKVYSDGTVLHCCLGVACRVAMRQGLKLQDMPDQREGYKVTTFDGHDGYLPESVQCWFAYPEDNPAGAASLNDGGESFAVIADKLETLFPSS